MSDLRFFYVPNALEQCQRRDQIPVAALGNESAHALKVLRMREGDPINIIDGKGHLIKAVLGGAPCVETQTNPHVESRVPHKDTKVSRTESRKSARNGRNSSFTDANKGTFFIESVEEKTPLWPRSIHLCVAPTKNMERIEWLVEKAVEIGVDSISFVKCRYSERSSVNLERLNRIAAAAMTQSHKYFMPQINDIVPFTEIISSFCESNPSSTRFIAHCYDDIPRTFLLDASTPAEKVTESALLHDASQSAAPKSDCPLLVCVGPEGDFSKEEVELALTNGFLSVSLGESRLRTETAALVSVHLLHLFTSFHR